ncbi:cell envelope biogenesis protein TolA [uncultured Sphingomonas sp.]|uniref:cell envelope biogenesis protein TolA n=1 Tax=uncultured Sphingomonas sp. TaxID=158754 RepID=UPI0035CACCD7
MSAATLTSILRPPRRKRDGVWIAVLLSVTLHVALFVLLSIGLRDQEAPPPPPAPIDVVIAEDVGLVAKAPEAVTPPAESRAPEAGPPEDAAPAAPRDAAPEPAPPEPQPKAAPPPEPVAVAPPKPRPKTIAPPTPAKARPARAAPRTSLARPDVAPAQTAGRDSSSRQKKQRGSLLGDDFRKGLALSPSKSTTAAPKAAAMSAAAVADIRSKIAQQVQPCANRQIIPGPGAERILVTMLLRINRDGSLAGAPQIVGHEGVDEDNRRYMRQVDDRAIATFVGCSPLRGLPLELYDVPGGWSLFKLRYKLPG